MPYSTENDLSLQHVLTDSQSLQNDIHLYISNKDEKGLEEALYRAENICILLNKVINSARVNKRNA